MTSVKIEIQQLKKKMNFIVWLVMMPIVLTLLNLDDALS